MIEIVIPPWGMSQEQRMARLPPALVNCVAQFQANYPNLDNDTQERRADRKFEELNPGVCVLYNPDRVVWQDDQEYTMFVLRWS